MKRSTPLKRSAAPMKRSPIRSVSTKRARENREYEPWSKELRRTVGRCQIRWEGVCTGKPQSVHHVMKLSAGGARVPGPLADAQGQRFMVACYNCNVQVEDEPDEAKARGFSLPNPLRRMDR